MRFEYELLDWVNREVERCLKDMRFDYEVDARRTDKEIEYALRRIIRTCQRTLLEAEHDL